MRNSQEEDSMSSQHETEAKVSWTYDLEELLIGRVLEYMRTYEMVTPSFKGSVWVKVADQFNSISGKNWHRDCLKTKIFCLKGEYQIWTQMKAQTQTGMGFDNERQMFVYHDWDELEKAETGTGKRAESSLYRFEISDDGNEYEAADLGDDDDSHVTWKSTSKRPLSKVVAGQTSGRGSKKSKSETKSAGTSGSVDETMAKLSDFCEARKSKYKSNPVSEAMKVLQETGLPMTDFLRVVQWFADYDRRASWFIAMTVEQRRELDQFIVFCCFHIF